MILKENSLLFFIGQSDQLKNDIIWLLHFWDIDIQMCSKYFFTTKSSLLPMTAFPWNIAPLVIYENVYWYMLYLNCSQIPHTDALEICWSSAGYICINRQSSHPYWLKQYRCNQSAWPRGIAILNCTQCTL